MRENFKRRAASIIALLLAVAVMAGCAQQVGDVDRTQPNLIEKEQFLTDDEWFVQQTVVNTDMQGSLIFAALQGDLKRVRWTVTERVLYAHSTVELADGLMDGFDEEDARRLGVVAAFPIMGHVDVQRAYNAATGEPSNVIMENASDRPWYERKYMRVDWSRNMAEGIRMLGMYMGMAPIQHNFPQEDGFVNPNRTRISDGIVDATTEYSTNTDIYACYGAFGYDSIFSCEGGRATMRTFFMRVPEEETYIPLNYTDNRQITRDGTEGGEPMLVSSVYDPTLGYEVLVECTDPIKNWMLERDGTHFENRCRPATFDMHARFGYFRTERIAWDRFVGTADDTRRYWVNRWNIWETMLDEDGNRLPMAERTPKPITYHLNLEYPEFMFDAAQVTADEWDRAFRGAVKVAMGIDDEELDGILEDRYGHNKMFRIVENSCHPGPLVQWKNEYGVDQADDRLSVDGIFREYVGSISDDAQLERALWGLSNEARTNLCAKLEWATETRPEEEHQYTWERFGDLRYSFFNWVETDVPWAGYGPSAADPKTGELIQGNANFAGSYIRRISTYAADVVQYFNGELSDFDIKAGTQIRRQLFHDEDSASNRFGLTPEASREMALRAGVNPADASATNFEERPGVDEIHPFVLRHGKNEMLRQADLHSIADTRRNAEDTRMIDFLSQPAVKNFLLGSVETQLALEAQARERFGPEYDAEQFHQTYLDFHAPMVFSDRMIVRDRMLQERNIMTHDALENMVQALVTYQGVADYFKGRDRTELIEYFMNKMFIGTQLHEIGHTVGLRHNFSASTDALNFHDEWWDIELAVVEGRITREEAYSLQGAMAEEVAPGFDYLSQSEFQLASVMDYTGDMTGRFQGLGKYDIAAIKFAYGEVVEQWDEDIQLPNLLSWETWLSDYKELPLIFGANGGGNEADIYRRGVEIIQNGRVYVPIEEAKAQRREGIRDNTERWINFDFGPGAEPYMDRAVDYEFCSDEFRGQVLNCAIWDYGVNQTEIVNHQFDTYRAFQTFRRYRRHGINRGYENLNGFYNWLVRTFMITQEPFRYYSFYRWYDLGAYTDDLRRASIDSFNFYNEVMATPEPGRYCMYDANNTAVDANWFFNLENTYLPANFHGDGGNCSGFVDIALGDGQIYNYAFTDEYDYRIDRVGTFIDKMVASQMMFNISANFAQSAFLTDFRATNASYWTTFKDEMLGMMRGLILGDYQTFGGVIEQGEYHSPITADVATLGTGVPSSQEGKPRIYTPNSINHQFNLLVGGMIYSSGWEDREVDFSHYVKVAVANTERQPFGAGVPVKEFQHPVTHQIYQVADIEGRTISGEMIDRANYLADRFLEVDELYQEATPGSAEYAQLRSIRADRLEQMEDIVSSMDMIRFVFEALGANALY